MEGALTRERQREIAFLTQMHSHVSTTPMMMYGKGRGRDSYYVMMKEKRDEHGILESRRIKKVYEYGGNVVNAPGNVSVKRSSSMKKWTQRASQWSQRLVAAIMHLMEICGTK